MKRSEVDRLRKFLNLTTSTQDGEALAAIRHANRLLGQAGVTWDRLFDRLLGAATGAYAGATVAPNARPQAPGRAWQPGDGMEDARAYGGRASGFGADEDPKPKTHDEPDGPPGYEDGDPGYEAAEEQAQPRGPVIDREKEQKLVAIAKAFEVLDRVGVPEEAEGFIKSLRAQFRRKGELSDKQVTALQKFEKGALKRENGRG